MDTIPPEIARKLLNRDFANLAQRVQRGGKLNRAERAMLQGMAASAGQTSTVAENYVELSKILGVTRRSVQNWRKRKDAPKPMANGFHEVAAWREFMQRHGLEGDPAATDAESALRARKLLAEVEERELRLAVRRREYVPLEEVRESWTTLVGKRLEVLQYALREAVEQWDVDAICRLADKLRGTNERIEAERIEAADVAALAHVLRTGGNLPDELPAKP